MSVPYVDPDLYMDTPLNALTRSSDIIEKQLRDMGVSLDQADPVSAEDSNARNSMQPITQDASVNSPLDIFSVKTETTVPPTETGKSMESTPVSSKRIVMNGPKPTNETLGQVAESYGMPTSFKTILDDAQDAFVGILGDLTRAKDEPMSYQEIFGKENRLRGLGSLFIIIGIIGVLLGGLSG